MRQINSNHIWGFCRTSKLAINYSSDTSDPIIMGEKTTHCAIRKLSLE